VQVVQEGFEKKMEAAHGAEWRKLASFGCWEHTDDKSIQSQLKTIFVGTTVSERERYLALTTPVLVMIEGGPGALNEAKIAQQNKRFVLPVGCLGGQAEVLGANGHQAAWLKENGLSDLYKSLQAQPALTKADEGKTAVVINGELFVDGVLRETVELEQQIERSDAAARKSEMRRSKVEHTGSANVPVLSRSSSSRRTLHGTISNLLKAATKTRGSVTILSVEEFVHGLVVLKSDTTHEEEMFKNPMAPLRLNPEQIATNLCELISRLPPSVEPQNKDLIDNAKRTEWRRTTPKDVTFCENIADVSRFIQKVSKDDRERYAKEMSQAERERYLRQHTHGWAVTIDGHGSKNQFFDMNAERLERRLLPVIQYLDQKLGAKNWVALTGGDPYQKRVDDTGLLLHVLRMRFGVRCIAIQCHVYADAIFKPETDGSLPLAYQYLEGGAVMPYQTMYQLDAAGLNEIQFGGYGEEGELVGASKYWFDETHMLKYIAFGIAAGGGPIAQNNISHCISGNSQDPRQHRPIPVIYMPFRVKNPGAGRQPGEWFGQVHDFMFQTKHLRLIRKDDFIKEMGNHSPDSVWFVFDPSKR